MNDRESAGALAGIRVLDLGRVLAAPWATQILGDLGADVIKVERPGQGDIARLYGPASLPDDRGGATRETSFHLSANRNKRGVTINLASPEGQDLVRRLAAQSDVLVENYIPGTLARYGLDYASLRAVNPRLVYCSLTGYGQDGPLAGRPGFDGIFQAQSGLMSVTGAADDEPGGGPMKTGPSLVDIMTGYNAAIGILAALSHRDRVSGEGQHLDIALLDTAIAAQSHIMANYLISGETPARRGTQGNGGGPAQVFRCADRDIYISVGGDANFVDLCAVLKRPDLAEDPRFDSMTGRWDNRRQLTEILDPLVAAWPAGALTDALGAANVPASTVNDYPAVFADEQVRHRAIKIAIAHPASASGTIETIASPIRLSASPCHYDRHPPMLGEHNQDVFGELLGLMPEDIRRLQESGAI